MGSEALEHAVAAGEWDLAVELVAEHWFDLFVCGQGDAIRGLVDALPPDRLRSDAELGAALACAAFEVGHAEAGQEHLEQAREAESLLPAARRRRYLETLALARLYRARLYGDFETALEAADELLAEAAAHGGWSDDARQALVRTQLGRTALWAHKLPRARAELEQGVSQARAAGLDYVTVSAQSALGLPRSWSTGRSARRARARRSRWPSAAAGCPPSRPPPRTPRWRSPRSTTCAPTTRASTSRTPARRCAAATPATSSSCSTTWTRAWPAPPGTRRRAARARRLRGHAPPRDAVDVRGRGDGQHARAAARGHRRLHGGRGDARAPARHPWLDVQVTAARLELAAGNAEAASSSSIAADLTGVHVVATVEHAVLEAIARESAGEPGRAGKALERALDLAERTGHRWTFLEGGRRVEALLRRQIRTGTAHRAIAGELLLAFEDRDDERRTVAPLLEPLSERECAILRYLPTTLSNREIAAELFVTTNTVKTHLRSIYRKLDVARRREAVDRARDLRLLSSGTASARRASAGRTPPRPSGSGIQ